MRLDEERAEPPEAGEVGGRRGADGHGRRAGGLHAPGGTFSRP